MIFSNPHSHLPFTADALDPSAIRRICSPSVTSHFPNFFPMRDFPSFNLLGIVPNATWDGHEPGAATRWLTPLKPSHRTCYEKAVCRFVLVAHLAQISCT